MRRAISAIGLGAALALMPAPAVAAPVAKAPAAAKKLRLKAFSSCTALIRYGRRFAPRGPGAGPAPPLVDDFVSVPPLRSDGGALPVPSPGAERTGAGAGEDSGTNVQEAGVDEPDSVKTAGGRIFAVAGSSVHALDPDGPRLLGSLKLEGWGHQLLLARGKLLVISQAEPLGASSRAAIAPAQSFAHVTVLTEVDVSDPGAMKILRTERIRGSHVSSRLIGSSARVVVWSRPRAVLEPAFRARLRGWLPRRVLRRRGGSEPRFRRAARCGRVLRPALFSGTDTLTVLTVDLAKGLPAVDSDVILSAGQIAYASKDSLYVATPRWTPEPSAASRPPERTSTLIHRFDISDPDATSYRASGSVPGYLLNQFSMSEHRDVLRVASTEEPSWWEGSTDEQSESRVTTLAARGGELVELGHAGGLGKGERIYAVRFAGDAGYVVTFRQIDPLYTLDLSRPVAPRVAGELKILGYSAYLHPIGDDLLLGVGRDASERGTLGGTQLSLFDVSNLARPRRLHQRRVGAESSSTVEYDHHAFLWWAPAKLAVVPVQSFDYWRGGEAFTGAVGFSVDRGAGISEAGRASHDADAERFPWPVERTFVASGKLFTLSQVGLAHNSLADLSQQGWVGFPQG